MPVLCVGGRYNIGEMMAKAMSGIAETVSSAVIEDAGHWLSDENPAALSAALREFFDKR
jgi:pimeloyl-ACP methyl ester carboxylesterase